MSKRLPVLGSDLEELEQLADGQGATVHVVSLGCPKNQVDTDVMLGHLGRAGYRSVDSPEDADLLLVNTCTFVDDATEESVSAILELAEYKVARPGTRLVVSGCLAQRHGQDLLEQLPEVDAFVGTGEVHRVLEAVSKGGVWVGAPEWVQRAQEPRVNSLLPHLAYLKILEGCPQSCSFCIIPKLRGKLRSRPLEDLLREAELLAAQGVRELMLVGQDCSSWGYDLGKRRLAQLLGALNQVEGIEWIRVMYLYPARVRAPLLQAMAELEKVVPYIDMPLQHASSSVLERMNRGTTLEKQRALLAQMRAIIPGLAVRSGFILGFPGEREEDLQQLLEFVEEQAFEHLGAFCFSAQDGTAAALLGPTVPPALARERRDRLMELQQSISLDRNRGMVGSEVLVRVDGEHPESGLLMVGRMPTQAPEIDGLVLLTDAEEGARVPEAGDCVRARVTRAHPYDLEATVLAK